MVDASSRLQIKRGEGFEFGKKLDVIFKDFGRSVGKAQFWMNSVSGRSENSTWFTPGVVHTRAM